MMALLLFNLHLQLKSIMFGALAYSAIDGTKGFDYIERGAELWCT